jgi:hypothetical protein
LRHVQIDRIDPPLKLILQLCKYGKGLQETR